MNESNIKNLQLDQQLLRQVHKPKITLQVDVFSVKILNLETCIFSILISNFFTLSRSYASYTPTTKVGRRWGSLLIFRQIWSAAVAMHIFLAHVFNMIT